MKKAVWNYVVDAATLAVMLGVAVTGLVLAFVLPSGSPRRGLTLLEMGRHDWGEVHAWLTLALGVLLLVHVALHWGWVCVMTRNVVLRGRRRGAIAAHARWSWGLLGLGVLALVLAGTVTGGRALVEGPKPTTATHSQGDAHNGEPDRARKAGDGRGEGRRR